VKIAVNCRLLIKNRLDGIGWFSYETLKRITSNHPEHKFYFLFDRPFSEEFVFNNNITPLNIGFPARHPILFYLWFEHAIPNVLENINPDVFLSTDGYLSLKTKVDSLPVIHDLNFEHYPKQLPYLTREYYKRFFPAFAKKAKRIATVSNYSKQDIHETYGIENEYIDVVYNGANASYKPCSEENKRKTREKYSDGKPYFLFIGTLQPRKNLANLFLAFDQFKNNTSNDIKLMIIGEKKWWTKEIRNAYEKMENRMDVIFKGHTAPSELKLIIPSALALTYVSFFEGFGIPIVEAMRSGTPVITSKSSSMPEVAGDAALLSDPFSVNSIAQNMIVIASDIELRKNLIAKGLERAKKYTWDITAEKLWHSIEKTIAL